MATQKLQSNPMMHHLIQALNQGEDIGHYGRLVFTIVARHFLPGDTIVELLTGNGGISDTEARSLLLQVDEHDYNPPRREKILEWQSRQDFPICPDLDNPDSCNLYQGLPFPKKVYDSISSFYEQRVEAQEAS